MGWYYDPVTRKSKIESLRRSWETQAAGGVTARTTFLAHCYRGGAFAGVLWSIWERTFIKDGQAAQPTERWINCDLMHCRGGLWGHKPMEEAMHPYYLLLVPTGLPVQGASGDLRRPCRVAGARRAIPRPASGQAAGQRPGKGQANLAAAAGQRA